jgi:hypothetical protein
MSVEDADKETKSKIQVGVFPGTLRGLIDTLMPRSSRNTEGAGLFAGANPPPWPITDPPHDHLELARLPRLPGKRPAHATPEPPRILGRASHVAVLPRHPVLRHSQDLPDQGEP